MPSSEAEKPRRQEEEKVVRIDDNTVVKVTKSSPGNRARPSYRCEECDASFPSPLDLDEHNKIDHARKEGFAA